MSKPNSATGSRFAAFYALCADNQLECSQMVRTSLVGSAIVLAVVAFLLRALVAHPLPMISAELVGNAAYGGFDAMVLPGGASDPGTQPPVDATAVLNGMLLAITLVTGGFACLAFLVDCIVRGGAIAHRLSTGRKLPEAEGGD